jgi:hypothetical protein
VGQSGISHQQLETWLARVLVAPVCQAHTEVAASTPKLALKLLFPKAGSEVTALRGRSGAQCHGGSIGVTVLLMTKSWWAKVSAAPWGATNEGHQQPCEAQKASPLAA